MAKYTYTPSTYDPFKTSDETNGLYTSKTTAEKAYTDAINAGYTWDRQEEYNTLVSDYQNRKDFSYDFSADALYQQYKDKYIQQGKMAMADTMGQAAAMTGGYGNSYAATAGNQAYQAQLQNLNDVIPQLYQMAYDRHNQKGQDMLNMIGLMDNERSFDYGTWSDKIARLDADRSYYGTEYDNAWNRDYSMYTSDRTLAQNEHATSEGYKYQTERDAVADEQWQKEYNAKYGEEKSYVGETGPLPKTQKTTPIFKQEKEDESAMYKGWGAADWEGYLAGIRNSEGKAAAEQELNRLTSAGLIPKNMVTYAAIGARGKLGH